MNPTSGAVAARTSATRPDVGGREPARGLVEQVGHLPGEQFPDDGGAERVARTGPACVPSDPLGGPRPELDAAQVVERDEPEPEGVVGVVRVVGEAVAPRPRPGLRAAAGRASRNSAHSGASPARCAGRTPRAPRTTGSARGTRGSVPPAHRRGAGRTGCGRTRRAASRHSLRASSPAWPNGGWPMSWARAMASVRSSLSRSRRATVRAICVTSRVCVSRVRWWSLIVRDEHLRLAGHAAEGGAVDDALAVALVERCGRGGRVRRAGARGWRHAAWRRGRARRPRARRSSAVVVIGARQWSVPSADRTARRATAR